MLDPKILRQDLDGVTANLARRGFKLDRDRYLALEAERKELQTRVEGLRQTRNERSKAIGRAKAAGGDVEALKREVGFPRRGAWARRGAASGDRNRARRALGRDPEPAARVGSERRRLLGQRRAATRRGTPPKFTFEPLDHVALGEKLGLIDFDAAAKLSGSRFVVLKGAVARLHRAIAQLMLDMHTQRAWLQRDLRAVSRQRRDAIWYGSTTEVRRGSVRARRREQAAPDSHGRGLADESWCATRSWRPSSCRCV